MSDFNKFFAALTGKVLSANYPLGSATARAK